MDGPDLFVVCKNCQAEVSPYITECPYCGHRLRKRAPKIERDGRGGDARPKTPRRTRSTRPGPGPGPSSEPSRLRPRRASAPRPRRERSVYDTRSAKPWATIVLVAGSILFTLAGRAGAYEVLDVIAGPPGDDLRRAATAPFFYFGTGYELVALGVTFLFGWLLERRHGPLVVVAVFLLGAVGGMLANQAIEPGVFAAGANGGALALLAAWAVRHVLARRRQEDVESDLLGVLVMAVVVVLLPIAAEEARPFAGAAGGIVGFLVGFPLARLSGRE